MFCLIGSPSTARTATAETGKRYSSLQAGLINIQNEVCQGRVFGSSGQAYASETLKHVLCTLQLARTQRLVLDVLRMFSVRLEQGRMRLRIYFVRTENSEDCMNSVRLMHPRSNLGLNWDLLQDCGLEGHFHRWGCY